MRSEKDKSLYKEIAELMARCERIEVRCEDKINTLRAQNKAEIKKLKEEHKRETDRLNGKISELEKENKALKAENALLKEDLERLKSNASNNSRNSSLPPSTDQKPSKRANTYNGREKSGRKPGGQPGHKGATLTKEKVEEKIREGKYRHEVEDIGGDSPEYVSRYILDIEVVPVATEIRIHANRDGKYEIPDKYRSAVIYGDRIKAMAVYLYGEGVVSEERIGAFIAAISDGSVPLTNGSAYNFCKEFAKKSGKSIGHIKKELLDSRVLYTDATHVTTNGCQEYIRNQSTDEAVLYSPMEKKDIQTLKETGILGKYAGITVNDHETALYHIGIDTGECNVHLIRYNKKNSEETGNSWSGDMTSLLCEMNDKKKSLMREGKTGMPAEDLEAYSQRYDRIISDGRAQNKKTKGKTAKKEEKALLNRLEKYKHNHLLFACNFEVGFSDNMSERDLRKCKNRQKMAGGFRNQEGKGMFCTILSIIETCKRKGMNVLDAIIRIFQCENNIYATSPI